MSSLSFSLAAMAISLPLLLLLLLLGYDGGLSQIFTLELYLIHTSSTGTEAEAAEARSYLLVRNLTAASPSFVVERLQPASILEAAVYASNREGRSEVARVKASTLKRPAAEKRLRFAGGDVRGGDGRGKHRHVNGPVLLRSEHA